jgi:carbon storage regulator
MSHLVLARRVGEKIMIGDDIEVYVHGFGGNQVKLGITAPPGVAVHRFEVYRRVQLGLEPLRGRGRRAVDGDDEDPAA